MKERKRGLRYCATCEDDVGDSSPTVSVEHVLPHLQGVLQVAVATAQAHQ